ncbi:GlyGly-CTERM sorting domain-containing protein [Bacteroides uniformis]|nr:GlyGly-CTERM sorting domain-containing protein [Bacteroides uniformis]
MLQCPATTLHWWSALPLCLLSGRRKRYG